MANDLTGDFDVVAQFAIGAANRLLASMHRSERFLHSISMRVDDTDPGPNHTSVLGQVDIVGVAIADQDRLGNPPPVPPSGGSRSPFPILDDIVNVDFAGVAVDPIVPSQLKGRAQAQLFPPTVDVPDNSGKRLAVTIPIIARYFPDPGTSPLAEFVRGQIQITASITQVASQVGRVIELDLKSSDVAISFAASFASTPLTAEDTAGIDLLLRNALKNSFLPSNAALPPNITHVDFKTLRASRNALAVLLTLTPGGAPGSFASVGNVFLQAGDDFAFAAGADFVKASLQSTLDSILSQPVDPVRFDIDAVFHTFHITYTVTLNSAAIALEAGQILLTIAGHAHTATSWLPDFNFTVKQDFTLAPDGSTADLVIGDLSLDTDSFIADRFTGAAIASIAKARDRALAQSGAQQTVRRLLGADENFGGLLASLLRPPQNSTTNPPPEPPRLAYTSVDITPSGIVLHGALSVPDFPPVHVEFVEIPPVGPITSPLDLPAYSALNSWIPGGFVERYEWSRLGQQGVAFEPNRFIFEERPSAVATAAAAGPAGAAGGAIVANPPVTNAVLGYHPLCLTVRGTRLTPSGPVAAQSVSGSVCGYNSFPVSGGFNAAALRAVPLVALPHARSDGRVEVTGHTPARVDPTGTRIPNRLIHFADAKTVGEIETLVAALLESKRSDAPAAVIVVLAADQLAAAPFVAGVTYADDENGAWSGLFGPVTQRPLTLLLGPKGNTLWRHEGPVDKRALVGALRGNLVGLKAMRPALLPSAVPIGLQPPNLIFEYAPGRELTLRKLRGRSATIVFWRSDSKPSLDAIRDAANRGNGSADAASIVIAVNDGEAADVAKRVFAENKLGGILLIDADRRVARAYRVQAWPTTIVVDKHGLVTRVAVGRDVPRETAQRQV